MTDLHPDAEQYALELLERWCRQSSDDWDDSELAKKLQHAIYDEITDIVYEYTLNHSIPATS